MNLFNRLVVVILLLAGILAWILAAIFVVFFPFIDKEFLVGVGDGISNLSRARIATDAVVVFAVISVVFVAGQLALLWFEVVPRRRRTVRLSNVSSGHAVLTVQAVAQRIKLDVEALDAVQRAKPAVRSRGRGVDVVLDVWTHPSVDVSGKSEEVGRIARAAVEKGLGVVLSKLIINLQFDPRASAPASPPAVGSPATASSSVTSAAQIASKPAAPPPPSKERRGRAAPTSKETGSAKPDGPPDSKEQS